MKNFALVVDFEATCDDKSRPRPQEIIEFPSVLVDLELGKLAAEFTSFVRPVHNPALTPFCRELTAIRQVDVDGAPHFAEVLKLHQDWCQQHSLNPSNTTIVTCGDWDFETMFPGQLRVASPVIQYVPHLYWQWHNIKRSFAASTGTTKAPGMAGMLRRLGIDLVGHHHRGTEDARNIAQLVLRLRTMGADFAATGWLSPKKFPSVDILIDSGGQTKPATLHSRSIAALKKVAGRLFGKRVESLTLASSGDSIASDEMLLDIEPAHG